MEAKEVLVVGAGVNGLTTAITLLEEGHRVSIITRDPVFATSSSRAAALWFLHLLDGDPALPVSLSIETYRVFRRLTVAPASGVTMVPFVGLFRKPISDEELEKRLSALPAEAAAQHRVVRPSELASRWGVSADIKVGHEVPVPFVNMPVYLTFLQDRFERLGGALTLAECPSLKDKRFARFAAGRTVVNCSGYWAGEFAGDSDVTMSEGQLLRVSRPFGSEPAFFAEQQFDAKGSEIFTHIYTRADGTILGGIDRDVKAAPVFADNATAVDIRRRSASLQPDLGRSVVLAHWAGIRCKRTSGIRLEKEDVCGVDVVHNYGHAGAGVTCSWGSARAVAKLI